MSAQAVLWPPIQHAGMASGGLLRRQVGKTRRRRYRSGGAVGGPTRSGTSFSPVKEGTVDGICGYRPRPYRSLFESSVVSWLVPGARDASDAGDGPQS